MVLAHAFIWFHALHKFTGRFASGLEFAQAHALADIIEI